jgi:aminopeptidase
MEYTNETVYLLYDRESPLAIILSDVWIHIVKDLPHGIIREFEAPPQPLYRGGLVNPDNPHSKEQNRFVTNHNITENAKIWLDHHTALDAKITMNTSLSKSEENTETIDPQIESIKNELISLPAGSIVVLIQSTNFRLSTFRVRLELFHRGIHVVEFNHLAYIPEHEFDTFEKSLIYRTDEYIRLEKSFSEAMSQAKTTRIQSVNGEFLTYWPLENIRGNTGNYTNLANKGGTFPIWEVFTEAIDLSTVSGKCLVESYPREDFSVEHCTPFELSIINGRVERSPDFPAGFLKLYNWIEQYEWEVMVRELGCGLNPALTSSTPLSDINFYERKTGVHLSLGKKHGIYGKKLPKTELQRFHIDVFIAVEAVYFGEQKVFENNSWII